MIYFAKWKVVLVLVVCAVGLVYAAPNLLDRRVVAEWQETLPGWLPTKQVNFGLDLQGGSHLLLRVDFESVITERLESLIDGLRTELRSADIGYTGLGVDGDSAVFTSRDPADAARVEAIIDSIAEDVETTVDPVSGAVAVRYTEAAVQQLRDNAVIQSIEIIRIRIDELGTTEPTIQRQGLERILVQVPGVDDPERVKRLIGETARLTFHLLDERTPVTEALAGRVPPGSELMESWERTEEDAPVNYFVVRKSVRVSGENLVDAQATISENRPVVSFRFDSAGGRRFGNTTRDNVGNRLAIVLDGRVISAPRIETPILGGSGIIRGGFTVQTANDLALLLRAGALPADITVLEERSVGPSLGADSVAAGKVASMIGLLLVAGFMVAAYGLFGAMAVCALLFNLALILAVLSGIGATLTLPGIAGIVLTVGMAVDANVLIFERIREEIRHGRSPISAIDAGYSRALTTIIDSNLTTLIAATLLFAMGSGPIKGFAITLGIGILSSMFTAIMVTRLMVVTWLRRTRPTAIPI